MLLKNTQLRFLTPRPNNAGAIYAHLSSKVSITRKVQALLLSLVCVVITGCGGSQTSLAETARTTQRIGQFIDCCSKLQDQNVIGEIALTGDSWGRRRTALDFITAPVVLARVVKESKDSDIVKYAKERLDAINAGRSVDEVPIISWHSVGTGGTAIEVDKSSPTPWTQALSSIRKPR